METFSPNDVLLMLRSHISYEQSQKDLAAEIGVSQAFICGVLGGKKEPGPKVLKFLGLRRVIIYKRAKSRS